MNVLVKKKKKKKIEYCILNAEIIKREKMEKNK